MKGQGGNQGRGGPERARGRTREEEGHEDQEGGPGGRARKEGQEGGPGRRARREGQEGGPGGRARKEGQEGGPGGRARKEDQEGGPGRRTRKKGKKGTMNGRTEGVGNSSEGITSSVIVIVKALRTDGGDIPIRVLSKAAVPLSDEAITTATLKLVASPSGLELYIRIKWIWVTITQESQAMEVADTIDQSSN
ncbi:hypothetical protein BD769DRAFT_1637203 [Suillus cothurnatus]|nr:hypothetical protein BD769DRAFT_1637203 [Suillus cothurnatus]